MARGRHREFRRQPRRAALRALFHADRGPAHGDLLPRNPAVRPLRGAQRDARNPHDRALERHRHSAAGRLAGRGGLCRLPGLRRSRAAFLGRADLLRHDSAHRRHGPRVAAAGGLHEPRRQLGAGRRAGDVRHAGRHAGGQPRADGHAEEDGRRAPAHHHFRGLHRSVALRLYGRHLRAADAGDVCLLRQCLQTQIPRRASRPGTVPARRQIGRMIVLFPVFFTERKRPGRFS